MTQCRQFCFQIADLPAEGIQASGEVPCIDLGVTDEDRVTFPFPLRYDLQIVPINDRVLVRGNLETTVRMSCDRCLTPTDMRLQTADVCHYIEDPEVVTVDLTEALREDILLPLSQFCLCREDCRGLCPQCGRNLNEGNCSCTLVNEEAGLWNQLDVLNLSDD